MTNSPGDNECQERMLQAEGEGLWNRQAGGWGAQGPWRGQPSTVTQAQPSPALLRSLPMRLLSSGSPSESGQFAHYPKNIY